MEEIQILEIETGWFKNNSPMAMTYKQLEFISQLSTPDNLKGWTFRSSSQAMRSISKYDASNIIDCLLNGGKVLIK